MGSGIVKSGRLVQPPRSELTNFPYRELWLSLIPIHTYPSTTSPRTRVRRLNRRLTQDTSWEVQAQMVVASCAVLEAFPGDPDLLGEEKTTLLSIISVSTSTFVAWHCKLYPAPYGTLCLGVFFSKGPPSRDSVSLHGLLRQTDNGKRVLQGRFDSRCSIQDHALAFAGGVYPTSFMPSVP